MHRCAAGPLTSSGGDASYCLAALESGAGLEEASTRLGEASDAVSPVVETFTPEQQAQFEECTDAQAG